MKIRQFKIVVTDNLEGEKGEEIGDDLKEWKEQISKCLKGEYIELIEITNLDTGEKI